MFPNKNKKTEIISRAEHLHYLASLLFVPLLSLWSVGCPFSYNFQLQRFSLLVVNPAQLCSTGVCRLYLRHQHPPSACVCWVVPPENQNLITTFPSPTSHSFKSQVFVASEPANFRCFLISMSKIYSQIGGYLIIRISYTHWQAILNKMVANPNSFQLIHRFSIFFLQKSIHFLLNNIINFKWSVAI